MRRLNRSIRLPPAATRATPVYAGWQLEQMSIESLAAGERTL